MTGGPAGGALVEPAPAKVNLTLRVLGRRSDGLHSLESLVAFVDVGERLTLDPGGADGVRVEGRFADAIVGANTVATVIAKVRGLAAQARLGTIVIDKRIPVAAGIGGGSADAAAAIRLARRLNPDLASHEAWTALARAIGADVPVCLVGRPAMMWGTGEHVEPLPPLPRAGIVLANTLDPVPTSKTASVFRALRARALDDEPDARRPPPPFASPADLIAFVSAQGNDLEPAARSLMPRLGVVREALGALPGCLWAAMSGAGPTCFALFEDGVAAAAGAERLGADHAGWWVASGELA